MTHEERNALYNKLKEKSFIDPSFEMERDDRGAPCKCGGYMDPAPLTADDIAAFGCGREKEGEEYGCCAAAFVCRICKQRGSICKPAPEME